MRPSARMHHCVVRLPMDDWTTDAFFEPPLLHVSAWVVAWLMMWNVTTGATSAIAHAAALAMAVTLDGPCPNIHAVAQERHVRVPNTSSSRELVNQTEWWQLCQQQQPFVQTMVPGSAATTHGS